MSKRLSAAAAFAARAAHKGFIAELVVKLREARASGKPEKLDAVIRELEREARR